MVDYFHTEAFQITRAAMCVFSHCYNGAKRTSRQYIIGDNFRREFTNGKDNDQKGESLN